jgi:hypothetical protein
VAKVQPIPLGRKPGQRRVELPEEVQVSLAQLAGRTRQGLLAFAVGVGPEVFQTLLAEDVASIVGPRGRHQPGRTAYRHSTERSSVALGGRRVGVERPRVRTLAGEEVTLPTWAAFSGEELLSEMATERMLAWAVRPPLRGGPGAGGRRRGLWDVQVRGVPPVRGPGPARRSAS